MSRNILTSWGEVSEAIDTLLPLAQKTIHIFDSDLTAFQFDSSQRAGYLREFLRKSQTNTMKIVLQKTDSFKLMPRLIELLATYGHRFLVVQAPPGLAKLTDSMLLIDNAHAYIRFHHDQARSKLLLEEPDECADYLLRFENIWNEGGTPVSASTLGL